MGYSVQLIGPVSLVHDGVTLDIGGPKPRAVLAILALDAGHPVSTDRLTQLLWDNPPISARRTLQSYVARIRRASAPHPSIHTDDSGIVLDLPRDRVDLLEFERIAVDAINDLGAIENSTAALALQLARWERIASNVRRTAGLDAAIAPFEALHLSATEHLARSQIKDGLAAIAVAGLEGMVRNHPTRESLWELLALGHVRLGHTDLAMQVIQRAREALREELGVDLSTHLADVERQLLAPTRAGARQANGDDGNRSPSRNLSARVRAGTEPTLAAVMFTDVFRSVPAGRGMEQDRFEELRHANHLIVHDVVIAERALSAKIDEVGVVGVFRSASDALRAACRIQRRIPRRRQSLAGTVGVRIGIGVGDVLLHPAGSNDPVTAEASRLCHHAGAGEIICSELVASLVAACPEFAFVSVEAVPAVGPLGPMSVRRLDCGHRIG